MKIESRKQQEAGSAFHDYLSSSEAADNLDFLVVASSREDPETVVCLTGHRSLGSADKLVLVREIFHRHILDPPVLMPINLGQGAHQTQKSTWQINRLGK